MEWRHCAKRFPIAAWPFWIPLSFRPTETYKRCWLSPVLHGEDYYQKPPLLYWLIMIAYQIFGVHDWAARLVPTLAGILVVLVTYLWALRTLGLRAALIGSLTLCLSPRFLYMDSMVSMDGLLCLWVVAGLACGHVAMATRSQESEARSQELQCRNFASVKYHSAPDSCLRTPVSFFWWLLSALFCALGVLTKGPVALVLILGPMAAWCFLGRRNGRVRAGWWLVYVGVVVLVAGPWYVAAALRDPDAAETFFWLHNVVRYVSPFDHVKPVWYYLPGVLLGLLPWSLLLVPLCYQAARNRLPRLTPRLAGTGFFVLSGLWCLVFFSLSGSKRPGYILPALPPLAITLGTFSVRAIQWSARAKAAAGVCAGAVAVAVLIASQTWLTEYHRHYALRDLVQPHAEVGRELMVVSYPKCWDSVSFYLGREVACFGIDERTELYRRLENQGTLMFVKNDKSGADLIGDLPTSLEFVPCGPHGLNIRAGIVRKRHANSVLTKEQLQPALLP